MNQGNANIFNSSQQDPGMRQFKVICVGDSQAGKTSLIQRFVSDMFD